MDREHFGIGSLLPALYGQRDGFKNAYGGVAFFGGIACR